jgi:Flp pilus assembly protein TadD
VRIAIAISKLQAASGAAESAVETARRALREHPADAGLLEQLATLFADTGNTVQLDATVAALQAAASDRAPTLYFAAVAAFLHGNPEEAVRLAERAIAADPGYAATYDLVGAAYTRLEKVDLARRAFERSLTFDAHDSTAYTNLGLLELAAGNQAAARGFFAEALWLTPDSTTARQGLARTR